VAETDDDLRVRVADLEATLTTLRADVARLTERLDANAAPRRAPAPGPAPEAAPTPRTAPTRPRSWPAPDDGADLESMVGRYGVLALATITTLAAVGTFVSWAAAHGLLGPTTRVVLGLLLAAALAGGGLRLRRREPSFGSALLGLALAVVHVCAWAAGPGLHLVDSSVAFALAAASSAALAAYSAAQHDEPLWCIGLGGVAIAPFVTSDHAGSLLLLASYGAAVGVTGAAGIGTRAWRNAERTLAAAVALYVLVLAVPGVAPDWGLLLAVALPLAVGLAGVLPFTDAGLVRPRLRAQGAMAAIAAVWVSAQVLPLSAQWASVAFSVGGICWLVMVDLTADAPAMREGVDRASIFAPAWVDGAFIPLLIAFAAGAAGPATPWWRAGVAAGAAVVLALAVSRRGSGSLRDAVALACALSALTAVNLAPWTWAVAIPVADAALGVAFVAALRWRPSHSWLYMGALALVGGSAHAWALMGQRAAFAYAPFATRESMAALLILVAWGLVASRFDRWGAALAGPSPAGAGTRDDFALVARGARVMPWVWAFVWAHREVAMAGSPAAAVLALVSLEAGAAVAAVGVGRVRDVRALRRVGLGLAVVAALRALAAADSVRSVAVRIASYLVASAFLLGIAYWYRRRGGDAALGDRRAAAPPEL